MQVEEVGTGGGGFQGDQRNSEEDCGEISHVVVQTDAETGDEDDDVQPKSCPGADFYNRVSPEVLPQEMDISPSQTE